MAETEKESVLALRNGMTVKQLKKITSVLNKSLFTENHIESMAHDILMNVDSVLIEDEKGIRFESLKGKCELMKDTLVKIRKVLVKLKNRFWTQNPSTEIAENIFSTLKEKTISQRDSMIFGAKSVESSTQERLAEFYVDMSKSYADKKAGAEYLDSILDAWEEKGYLADGYPFLFLKGQIAKLLMEAGEGDAAKPYVDDLKKVDLEFLTKFFHLCGTVDKMVLGRCYDDVEDKQESNLVRGQMLEVVLAKPQTEKNFDAASPHNAVPHHNYIPYPGYGAFPVNPYAPLTAGYGTAGGFQQQPMIYGRGPMPSGMQTVPMVLPDGQIDYVLQQPGVQAPPVRPRKNDRNNGAGGPQGRGGSSGSTDDSTRGRRYRPY